MSYEYKEREVKIQPEQEFRFRNGKLTGYISSFFGVLSLVAVLAYLFPSYLTTTELRAVYDAEQLQVVLKYAMWTAIATGLISIVLNKRKTLGAIGIGATLVGFALGGYNIPVGPVEPKEFSLGVDWLLLAFLASVGIFMILEKIFPKYPDQVILRDEWKTDFVYFCFNHLIISIMLLISNFFVSQMHWALSPAVEATVQAWPMLVQFVFVILIVDFVLYWEHRIFHEVTSLWHFHAVHHSIETMDWLAGSRSHFVHSIIERTLVVVALFLIGVSKAVIDIYVVFAAIQSIIIHSNLKLPWGPLKYIFVTPQYHHWHHSSEEPAIDTNYSAHLVLYDRIFNTYHMPKEHWPAHYGTVHRLPCTFMKQLVYPFKKLFD